MLGRRFLLIVAVLMGLTALAASVAPREQAARDGSRAGRAQPAPSATPESSPLETVRHEISADELGQRVEVSEGDAVRMLGEIDVGAPNTAARFHIVADGVGDHPIELVGSRRRIGTLAVGEHRP